MPVPKLSEKQISDLARLVPGYIAEQRASLIEKASPIASQHVEKLRAFFPGDVLSRVRVVRGRASEPKFYPLLRTMGIHNASLTLLFSTSA